MAAKIVALDSAGKTWKGADSLTKATLKAKMTNTSFGGVLAEGIVALDSMTTFVWPSFGGVLARHTQPGIDDVTPDATIPAGPLALYPNPTTGAFHINMLSTGTLALYNIQGQLIYSTPLQEGANDLRMPGGAAAGIYVTRIQSADGTNLVLRLVYQP